MLVLLFILPAPMLGVVCSFYLPSWNGINVGGGIWLLAKVWLIVLPLLWLLCIDQQKVRWSPSSVQGIVAGIIAAIPVSIAIIATYWFAKNMLVSAESKQLIDELGIASPVTFFMFASTMSIFNSLMEEYVWRWFVFSKFKILVGVWPAIFLSSFFFTLHHIVIMWNFGSLWLVCIGSIGLFSGGVIWAWLYNKYNSIWPGWICHVAADAVIMWIVWRIITS